jgi:hypothetical protein
MVGVFAFNLKVKGSNLESGVCIVTSGNVATLLWPSVGVKPNT